MGHMDGTAGIWHGELSGEQSLDRLCDCGLFLLDMDGTLYLGDDVYPGAREFILGLRDSGRDFIYLTNNSSRAGSDYVDRLRRLGFECEPENVYTSGMATGAYLKEHHPGERVYLLGTAALHRELRSYGIAVVNEPGGAGGDEADIVVAGFDTELVYHELDRAVHLLRRGARFIAANPDLVCPMPGGEVLPDCGSICALLTAASGSKPYYIGKPNRSMVDVIAAERGIGCGRICCIGDRLYTDIAVAQNAGAVSLLVLSGETRADEVRSMDADKRPDYVFDDVAAVGGAIL